MPKRNPRENARRRKASEDMTDDGPPSPPDKNKRYNLRDRKKPVLLMSDDTEWVEDDTLEDSDDDEQLCIEFHVTGLSDDSDADIDPFVQLLKNTFASGKPPAAKKRKREEDSTIELSQSEKKYFQSLEPAKRKELLSAMKRVSSLMLDEGDVPFKFKILQLPISDYMKTLVLKKIDALADMSGDSGGAYKLKTWVDGFLRIPFGKTVPLPVKLNDGVSKCTDFMVNSRSQMDKHIYGMKDAKTQIMQIISQWIVNPGSVGNVLALQGPMGVGKCHAKGTEILMYDGSIKLVEDIVVGDVIMGDDSSPRRVLTLGQGEDDMYDIIPVKGEKYTINSEHILCLKQSGVGSIKSITLKDGTIRFKTSRFNNMTHTFDTKRFNSYEQASEYLNSFNEEDNITEISVKDYLKLSEHTRNNWLKGYRKGVDFSYSHVEFDPYILGLWIGDGCSSKPLITSQDATILGYLNTKLREYDLILSHHGKYDYYVRSIDKRNENPMLECLQKYNLLNNKHIPRDYKCNDREIRLKLLAGLIDSDGYLVNNTYEITQKSDILAKDILYIARSLGFAAYLKRCEKSCIYKGDRKWGVYNRIFISGDIDEIPVKVERKKADMRRQIKDHLVTGIDVKYVGRGTYYGFTLDGNHRYLLGDFTVTHNTSFARNAIAEVLQRPFLFYTLGGASDISNFVGHSYTYEGSMCGRIVDGLMQCGVMNPVLYFDELDKVSATPHGEEIISMLIHLTDRSQNTEFHDRYFAGVDFDMSQCLFVFSFNDIEKVHPILRDRMNVIECGGYDEKDKLQILKNYVWPDILTRLSFTTEDIVFEEDAMKFIIDEYSSGEGGVRNLIRAVESAVTRLNMLRVSKHESMKDYPFYMDISFPLKLTPRMVKTLLTDGSKKKRDESWRMMYL